MTVATVRWSVWMRLLALVVWLPATSHCRLAALPSLNFLACGHDDTAAHHETPDDGDGCASVESGSYRSEEAFEVPGTRGGPTDEGFAWAEALAEWKALSPCDDSVTTGPPPEALHWSFRLRATGYARAPSRAS